MPWQRDNPCFLKDFCMRNRLSACALYFVVMAVPALAQTPPAPSPDTELVAPPAWAFNDVACAPALAPEKRDKNSDPPLRIIGVQDPAIREMFGPGDTLVVNAGSNAGLQPGQRFFVRRVIEGVTTTGPAPRATLHTVGWVQVLGVDTMVSTVTVVHACGDGILFDDYLEPYVAPMIAARPISGSIPQYENMGHIATGIEGLHNAAPGYVMMIDRGSSSGVVLGQRYIVFRNKRNESMDETGRSKAFLAAAKNPPLVQVGEVLVVAVRPEDATVLVVSSREAISTGDLIAPIR
jgi:hypothetical protein